MRLIQRKKSPRQCIASGSSDIRFTSITAPGKSVDHAGHFGGEILLRLLDALAGLEAGESLDGDLAAQLLGHLGNVLLHGDLVLLYEGLLQQAFVKENKVSVEKHIAEVAKQLGGKIAVKAFTRFQTGEGIEKAEEDFAAEVASMIH